MYDSKLNKNLKKCLNLLYNYHPYTVYTINNTTRLFGESDISPNIKKLWMDNNVKGLRLVEDKMCFRNLKLEDDLLRIPNVLRYLEIKYTKELLFEIGSLVANEYYMKYGKHPNKIEVKNNYYINPDEIKTDGKTLLIDSYNRADLCVMIKGLYNWFFNNEKDIYYIIDCINKDMGLGESRNSKKCSIIGVKNNFFENVWKWISHVRLTKDEFIRIIKILTPQYFMYEKNNRCNSRSKSKLDLGSDSDSDSSSYYNSDSSSYYDSDSDETCLTGPIGPIGPTSMDLCHKPNKK